MEDPYLHDHPEFEKLIRIVGEKEKISDILIEKDYWIMHCLYGLKNLGFQYQLKGGTSLSKRFHLIHRFSEDIDIRIEPPAELNVFSGHNHDKPIHCDSREKFYNWLSKNIHIPGIGQVDRDSNFDEKLKYRSGGIRLYYSSVTKKDLMPDIKEGILLEVGFDDIAPNTAKTITSWAYEHASGVIKIKDNRAHAIPCYHPGYTLVEKLQAISTKYRKQQEDGKFTQNFMRHYYDIYCLLGEPSILEFTATDEYRKHKERRFRKGDILCIRENPAFLLNNRFICEQYSKQYEISKTLYYKHKPSFEEILNRIKENAKDL